MVSMSQTAPNKFEIEARSQLLKSYVSEHCLEELTPQEALCEALEDPSFLAQVANMTSQLVEETTLADSGLETQLPQDAMLLTEDDVQRSAQLVCDAVIRSGELELLEGDPTVPDGAPVFDEEVLAKPAEPQSRADKLPPAWVLWWNVCAAIAAAVRLQTEREMLEQKRKETDRKEAAKRMKERYYGRNGVYILPR